MTQPVTQRDLAKRLLETVAADGEILAEILEDLADTVLADPRYQLALEVKTPGPHQLRRAMELAVLLCTEGAAMVRSTGREGR